jgi:transposase
MPHFLGLDVAKDSFVAALLNAAGEPVVAPATFSNSAEGFAALLAWLPQPAGTIGLCEPTGVYNQHLKHALAAALESLHELNAQTLKQFAFSQVRTKTDQADALLIADAARVLFLTKPEKLAKCRVALSPDRENLALWLAEHDRLRAAIVMLRHQIGDLDHHAASDAAQVQRRRQRELQHLLTEQKQVLRQIEQACRKLDDAQARLVDSIPGIGPLSTAATLVVVRDVSRGSVPLTRSRRIWGSTRGATSRANANGARIWRGTATRSCDMSCGTLPRPRSWSSTRPIPSANSWSVSCRKAAATTTRSAPSVASSYKSSTAS